MVRAAGLAALLSLASCATADAPSVATTERGSLRATRVEDYHWPSALRIDGPDGERLEADVFPLVAALVVDRHDGQPLHDRDEAASRAAARAYCIARGQRLPAGAGRLSGGAWVFPPCRSDTDRDGGTTTGSDAARR